MAKCPKCDSKITFGQLSRYNIWRPIVCQSCKVKLGFNKKEYIKNVAYLLGAAILIFIVELGFRSHLISGNQSPLLRIICQILFIFSFVRYFVSMNSIKLELKDENVVEIKKMIGIWILGSYLVLVGCTTSIVNIIVSLVPMIARREWNDDGIALFVAAFIARFLKVIFIAGMLFGGVLMFRLKEIGRIISIYSCSIVILLSLTMLIVESIIFKTSIWDSILILFIIYGIPIFFLTRPKVKEQLK